mgnify:CR=1 FL=1
MSDRLPPLTALRAFEAAARHMSFAHAADELNVTPAALSFQIKSLEEHLGQPVFRRLNRAVELTEAGRALAPGASEGFGVLNGAWRAARRLGNQRHLTVTAGPGFTSLWLARRMFSFAADHPGIELRLSASLNILDFDRDDVDVAIRFGSSSIDGLHALSLGLEWASPMVAPSLADKLKTPDDLKNLVLLVDEVSERVDSAMTWRNWYDAAGLGTPDQPVATFNTPEPAVSAAIAGTGVLMGRASLAGAALNDGRLVMPFDLALAAENSYRVVCPEHTANLPHIRAFFEWIDAEYAQVRALSAGRRIISVDGQ